VRVFPRLYGRPPVEPDVAAADICHDGSAQALAAAAARRGLPIPEDVARAARGRKPIDMPTRRDT